MTQESKKIPLARVTFAQAPEKTLIFNITNHSEQHVLGLDIDVHDTKQNTLGPLPDVFIGDIFKPRLQMGKKSNETLLNIQPLTQPVKIKLIQSKKDGSVKFVPQYKIDGKWCVVETIVVHANLSPLTVFFDISGSYRPNKDSHQTNQNHTDHNNERVCNETQKCFSGKIIKSVLSKKIMNDIELLTYIILIALVISVCMYLYLKSRGYFGPTGYDDQPDYQYETLPATTATERLEQQRAEQRRQVSAHYQPRDFGHRTGVYRVFNTNKGLRTYEINSEGYPLPPRPSK